MNIKEIIAEAIEKLRKNNIEDASIISKELLAYILKKDIQYLIINSEQEIPEEKIKCFENNIEKIIQGYPIQYITHKQEFMHASFYVDENVLIPQPDTEILVESVINICNKNKKQNVKILDLCTGSGAIAISLDMELKDLKPEIIASDISSNALEIAKKNNKENCTNVTFIESDLFNNIKQNNFDIIVSNPPYIKTNEIKKLSKQVQTEPSIALDGGEDGLEIYRRILEQAYKYLNNDGYLCLEIGYDQKQDLINLIKNYKYYVIVETVRDLSENDRCIIIKKEKTT